MATVRTSPLLDAHIRTFSLANLRRLDWATWLFVTLLAAIGIVVLYSATRTESVGTAYSVRQGTFFLFGCLLALTIACFDYRFLVSLAPIGYGVCLLLLVAVLMVGVTVKGGQRWLDIGPVRFQPSELTKLAVIFMLAWYFGKIGPRIRKLRYMLLAFVIAGIPAVLIFRQPNLGTAAAMAPIAFVMLYVAGCKRWHLAAIILAGLACAPVAWGVMKPYQRERVMTIISPESDAAGKGWHTIQSMITVGSGGMTGKGYMEGTQTYLRYLPEHHTDFIFSLLAEEFGFMGATIVIALYFLLFARALMIAGKSQEITGSLLVVGIVALLGFHVFVNIAITLGIMPVTGIPLPFLSYGRSFYVTTMACVGILLSVNVRRGMFGYQ